MSGISEEELLGCERAIAGLQEDIQPGADARAAQQAAARLWPADGQDLAVTPAGQLLTRAVEIGYALALRDVRDGTVTPAQPSAGAGRAAAAGRTDAPSRAQVIMCFVIGFAVFGSGTVANWSYIFGGPLHGRAGWLPAAGIPCMLVGLGLILGGGLGGQERRQTRTGDTGDRSSGKG
jgi:hypothetical protein